MFGEIQEQIYVNREVMQALPGMIEEWDTVTKPELAIAVVFVMALSAVHQHHHWVSFSDPYYGDHLLFQRIYDATSAEIDQLAEKAIGIGGPENVDPITQTRQVADLVGLLKSCGGASPNDLVRSSLQAEYTFLKIIDALVNIMGQKSLSLGTENLLAGIADAHEGHVYLLKQRITRTP